MNKTDKNQELIKRRRKNSADQRDQNAVGAIDQPQEGAKGDIFKLDIDCFEESFDYLLFGDLLSIGQTCKRLHQIVGYILQQNYGAVTIHWKSNEEQAFNSVPINHFKEFIQKIQIEGTNALQDIHQVQSKFYRLRRMDLLDLDLNEANLQNIKAIFRTIEHLALFNCTLDGNFHEMLALCPKIKRLSISPMKRRENLLIGNGNDWLHQKYPTLEYIEIDTDSKRLKIDELSVFLGLNPNVQDLSISDKFLKSNKRSLMAANVKLNSLAISINFGTFDAELFELVKKFHERDFFKRLKLYFSCAKLKQKHITQLATLNVVVKLQVACIDPLKLCSLRSLEELYVGHSNDIADLMEVPNNLNNLERIEFFTAFSDDIHTFVRHSLKLKRIKVYELKDGTHFNNENKIFDLMKLNKERAELHGAQQITIYVKEDIYLATKWALKDTDFNLVKLKRNEAYE